MTLYARRGEQLTCESGHVIATFASDHGYGDPITPETLTDLIPGLVIAYGRPLGDCPRCGAKWNMRSSEGQAYLHFAQGWR